MLKVLDRFLFCSNVPCACNVLLNGLWFLRRGPRCQLRILIRVCSSTRFGTLLSKRYFGWGEKCLLSWASRKMGFGTSFARQVSLQRCGTVTTHVAVELFRTPGNDSLSPSFVLCGDQFAAPSFDVASLPTHCLNKPQKKDNQGGFSKPSSPVPRSEGTLRNSKCYFTIMSLHINNQFAKRRGIVKNIVAYSPYSNVSRTV